MPQKSSGVLGHPGFRLPAEVDPRLAPIEHVIDPLIACLCASPSHHDLTATGGAQVVIGGHSDVAHEVGHIAPCDEIWVDNAGGAAGAGVGFGVEEVGDGVVDSEGGKDFGEEVAEAVLTVASLGVGRVGIQGVVGGIGKITAAEDEMAEGVVEGVQESLPVLGAQQLPILVACHESDTS